MQAAERNNKYFFYSITFHLVILAIFIFGFDSTSPLPVFENTNQNDVISAVVLGDTDKSKILTPSSITPPARQQKIKPDVIALKPAEKKRVITAPNFFAKDLLADIKKQKKIKQKQLQSHFQKTLRDQAEASLRQQLLNEQIKVQGTETRLSHGVVDKYKALILQAISEHWIIPSQAKKNLYSELMIRLAPGGMVLDVQIIKTSGDPSLDSSVRAAVMKASPLPVPGNPDEFEPFRQFVLKVKPENVLGQDT